MLTASDTDSLRPRTLSEKDKLQEKYIKNEIDITIQSITKRDRSRLETASKVRNGIRDQSDFEYLWKAYGTQFPSKLRHVPVLRAVFDALLGKYINQPFKWQISSSDSETVNYIFQEYRDAIISDVENYYISRIRAANMVIDGSHGDERQKAVTFLENLKKKYEGGKFQSEIEIDAKNVMSWSIGRFDLRGKVYALANDIITYGEAYYQVKVMNIGERPLIEVLNPKEVFVNKDHNTKLVRDCERIAVWKKMSVADIWTKFGSQMKPDDAKKFLGENKDYIVNSDIELVYYEYGTIDGSSVSPAHENYGKKDLSTMPVMNVYYVEYKTPIRVEVKDLPEGHLEGQYQEALDKLETKYKYRMDLFEGTRIGEEIYVGLGRNKFAIRNPDDEANTYLTINGIFYNDRNGEPYSLPVKIKDINDMIDIIYYHAETTMALSGSKAVNIDYADIPSWVGAGLPPAQRMMQWLGLLKQGLYTTERAQDGANLNQQGGASIDMSLGSSIQYLYDMADRQEAMAYKIVGISRQSVGNITQSDGKGTTELAIQGSETVIKPLFYTIDELAEAFFTDVVNAVRIAFKEGITGTLLMGEVGQRVFAVKSKRFPLAFLNVWINNDGEVERDLESIKLLAQNLTTAGMLDPAIGIDMVTIKSLTELKHKVKEALDSQKENDSSQKDQQLEQFQKQIQEMQAKLQQNDEAKSQIDQQKLAQDREKAQAELELKTKDLQNRMVTDSRKLDIEDRLADIQQLQLAYTKGPSKEVRNS